MFVISFPAAELALAAFWVLWRTAVCVRRGGIRWKREVLLLLLFADLAVILRFAFFPRDLVDGRVQPLVFDPATAFPFRVNLLPFVRLLEYDSVRDAVWNVAGNTAMFIPTGIVLPVLYRRRRTPEKAAAGGALISLCAEILQLPFADRVSDVDDLLLNVLGAAIGFGIWAACAGRKRRDARRKERTA